MWTPESNPVPGPFPEDAENQIELAEKLFRERSSTVVSYESLLCNVVNEMKLIQT
jgi:hypothetical protein